MKVFRLLYRSVFKGRVTQEEIEKLLANASVSNLNIGVTGVLIKQEDNCMQVLEGPQEVVEDLFYNKILHDKRHQRIRIISQGFIEDRFFKKWGVGYGVIENSKDIIHDDIVIRIMKYFEQTGNIELRDFWANKKDSE